MQYEHKHNHKLLRKFPRVIRHIKDKVKYAGAEEQSFWCFSSVVNEQIQMEGFCNERHVHEITQQTSQCGVSMNLEKRK